MVRLFQGAQYDNTKIGSWVSWKKVAFTAPMPQKKVGYNVPNSTLLWINLWRIVIWNGETKIVLYAHNHKSYVWKSFNKTCSEKNNITTVKHGGDSLVCLGVGALKTQGNL